MNRNHVTGETTNLAYPGRTNPATKKLIMMMLRKSPASSSGCSTGIEIATNSMRFLNVLVISYKNCQRGVQE